MQATDTSMYTCIYPRRSHEQFCHARVLILVHKPDYVQELRLHTWIDSVRLPLCLFKDDSMYLFDCIKLPEPQSEPLNEPFESLSELPRLPTPTTCHVAMMIAAKNGAVSTATTVMTTVRKARAPGNFVNADQITPYTVDQAFCLKLSHALLFF